MAFAGSSAAMAQTGSLTGYCDPTTEPDECACPEGMSCTVANFNQLKHANNPSALSTAAGVTSTWDAGNSRWNIELDVTQMAGEGVIVIDDDTGDYDSVQHLFDHLGDLIGQSLTPSADSNGVVRLPAMAVSQVGTTVRLYQDTNGVATWAPENSRSLFWDALTDREGRIRIDGIIVLDLFGSGVGCDGDDAKAFASGSATGLSAEQCSSAGTNLSPALSKNACIEDFGRSSCFLLVDRAQTLWRPVTRRTSAPRAPDFDVESTRTRAWVSAIRPAQEGS